MVGSAGAGARRIPFEPALEGLRGFALLGMLCFHAEFAWASGGFLPIATFFTLSGYLITSLFLVEWQRTGTLALGPFWARRFRRLMPAALLTLAGMSLFGAFVATPDQLGRLKDDVTWALFYGANWHFLFSDAAYTRLFEAPSPVHHFWSLAIEEQFYLAWPLVAFASLRLGGGSRTVVASVLALLVVGSVAASVVLTTSGASVDRVYYGSDTRAAELLLGALLAVVMGGRENLPAGTQRSFEWLGALALLGMVGTWSVVELSDRWLYLGGFAAYTVLSLVVIVAAVQPAGPVRALLSLPPMRWIGRVSYGAYLIHWPVYLWLDEARTGLGAIPLFALRVAVTFALAGLSYRYFESPIRAGRVLTGWRAAAVTPLAFAGVLLAVVAVTRATVPTGAATAEDQARLDAFIEQQGNDAIPANEPPPSLQHEPLRISVYGDSTALSLGMGLGIWVQDNDVGLFRAGVAELGCGIARAGKYRFKGDEFARASHCLDRTRAWPESARRAQPDVAVVLVGPWEVCDRKLPGDDRWRSLGDPVLDAYMRSELLAAADLLLAETALVLWLTHPAIDVRDPSADRPYPESDPARMRRWNQLVHELGRLRPEKLRVVDLAGYMQALPAGELDPAFRPDGTHLNLAGTLRLAREWLGPEVVRLAREEAERRARDAKRKTD